MIKRIIKTIQEHYDKDNNFTGKTIITKEFTEERIDESLQPNTPYTVDNAIAQKIDNQNQGGF